MQSQIRASIQAALRYPPAAAIMQLTGRAQVQLEYTAGSLRNIQIVRSAGSPLLDHAALAAVHDAVCPPPPAEIGNRTLPFVVWVELRAT